LRAVSVCIRRMYAKNEPPSFGSCPMVASTPTLAVSHWECGMQRNTKWTSEDYQAPPRTRLRLDHCTETIGEWAGKNNGETFKLRRDAFEVSRGTLTCTASVQNCASPSRSPFSCAGRLQTTVHEVRDLARPGARRCFRKVNPPPVEFTCRPSACTASACQRDPGPC